jgi:hypothetical protein
MILRSEERLFFPKELNCISTPLTFRCDLPPESKSIDSFLIVGQKLWNDNEEVLAACINTGFVERKIKGAP